jgi:hypothetical protein
MNCTFYFILIFFPGTTLQDVRLVLAKEEVTQAALGQIRQHKTSLSSFLMTGFELEDRQCVEFQSFFWKINQYFLTRYLLQHKVSQTKGKKTSKQLADIQEKRNALHRLIQNWREVQLVYTPHVASLISLTSSLPELSTTTTDPAPLSSLP